MTGGRGQVKAMAVSKLCEWLENRSGAFIRYRWGAALRTAHRRFIAFQQRRLLAAGEADRRRIALDLCRTVGLTVDSADERNELGETRLMQMAAEGRGARTLRLLVDSGALVNAARPDGVTPLWLAAQLGHAETVEALVGLGAGVDQAANDGATPAYIAAQNGNALCIEGLARLKADVRLADKAGTGPIHQARAGSSYPSWGPKAREHRARPPARPPARAGANAAGARPARFVFSPPPQRCGLNPGGIRAGRHEWAHRLHRRPARPRGEHRGAETGPASLPWTWP